MPMAVSADVVACLSFTESSIDKLNQKPTYSTVNRIECNNTKHLCHFNPYSCYDQSSPHHQQCQ